jgi:hypothetical protein
MLHYEIIKFEKYIHLQKYFVSSSFSYQTLLYNYTVEWIFKSKKKNTHTHMYI